MMEFGHFFGDIKSRRQHSHHIQPLGSYFKGNAGSAEHTEELLWQPSCMQQRVQRRRSSIQDRSTHCWPWVYVQTELLSTLMSCVHCNKNKKIKIKHCICAFVCVCVHLRAERYVCRSGSSLSGRIKGRNVFELFPSPTAVSPLHTHTRTPSQPPPPPPRIQRVAGFIHYS